MDSDITKWTNFLKDLERKDIQSLLVAIDRFFGIINANDPKSSNTRILFNDQFHEHVIRASEKEGWIEYVIPLNVEHGGVEYEVYNGNVVYKRKYGKVEIK